MHELLHRTYLLEMGRVCSPHQRIGDALDVIHGYQDLLRAIVDALAPGFFYKATTVSDTEFVIEGEDMVKHLLATVAEAKAAIPEVSHE